MSVGGYCSLLAFTVVMVGGYCSGELLPSPVVMSCWWLLFWCLLPSPVVMMLVGTVQVQTPELPSPVFMTTVVGTVLVSASCHLLS